MRSRSFGTIGGSNGASELDAHAPNLGETQGPKQGGITPIYNSDDAPPAAYERDGELLEVAYTQDGESELPGILNKPTAGDKSRSETADLDGAIDAYTKGRNKTSDPEQRAQFEWLIDQAKKLKKLAKAGKAREVDSTKHCLNCGEPCAGKSQYCHKCLAERKKEQARLRKQKQRNGVTQ